jgi:hypothetical protein
MLTHIFFATLLLMVPCATLAYQPDETMLRDYHGLTKALRANGVEPVGINWRVVHSMCLGLNTEKDHVPYNQCRFDAALNQAMFGDDRRSCLDDAERSVTPTMSVTAVDSAVSQQSQSISQSYSGCMRGLGWRSPNNWQRGRIAE